MKQKATSLTSRIKFERELDEKNQALFYSNWYFSAVRLLTSIPKFQNRDSIAEALGLTQARINRVLDFLIAVGLCVEDKDKIKMGPARTHVSRESPLVARHHANWRLKTLEKVNQIEDDEIVFTNPVTLSKKDFNKIREELAQFIEKFQSTVNPSEPELLCCLNIDWVHIKK